MEKLSLTNKGKQLDIAIIYPPSVKEQNSAILFVHGWTSEKERSYQYAHALSQLGFICFLFDMRGHGKSEGDIKAFTVKDFLDDVLAAYDYLANLNGVDKENISGVGSSFGSYLLALLSSKRNIKNLSLRVPADYRNEDFNISKYKASGSDNPVIVEWRSKARKFNETYALQAIHNYKGNIQIIESEKDTVVPHQTVQNYINAVPDKSRLTHVLLAGAPHSIKAGKFRNDITDILVQWFQDKVQ